jgi:hypothetical protein
VVSGLVDRGNCQLRNYPQRRHSSFNTTFNVLENLRIAAAQEAIEEPGGESRWNTLRMLRILRRRAS